MPVQPSKRSNMLLYADRESINSLRVKMIIAEKSAPADIIEISPQNIPQDFLEVSPHGIFPALIDRDLILTEPSIIAEYLDERFPHPPLLPVYPVARAKTRLMRLKIEQEWFSLANTINTSTNASQVKQAKKALLDSLISFSPVFASLPYFLSEDFSLLDCCVGPLLWHLSKMGSVIPSPHEAVFNAYMKRIFERPCFRASLNYEEYEPI
jgi:RNA polymerase-associated protein